MKKYFFSNDKNIEILHFYPRLSSINMLLKIANIHLLVWTTIFPLQIAHLLFEILLNGIFRLKLKPFCNTVKLLRKSHFLFVAIN